MKAKNFRQIGLFFLVFSLLFSSLNVTPAHALDVPTLIAPADGATTTVVDTPPLGIPEFKWGAVTGAATYRLQISPDTAFTYSRREYHHAKYFLHSHHCDLQMVHITGGSGWNHHPGG